MRFYIPHYICKQNINKFYSFGLKTDKFGYFYRTIPVESYDELQEQLSTIDQFKQTAREIQLLLIDQKGELCIRKRDMKRFELFKQTLYERMQAVIDLGSMMGIEEEGMGLDFSLPKCDDIKDYIEYLRDIDFVMTNVHICKILMRNFSLTQWV